MCCWASNLKRGLQFNMPFLGTSVAGKGSKRIVVADLRLNSVRALRGSGKEALANPVGMVAAPGSGILYTTDAAAKRAGGTSVVVEATGFDLTAARRRSSWSHELSNRMAAIMNYIASMAV